MGTHTNIGPQTKDFSQRPPRFKIEKAKLKTFIYKFFTRNMQKCITHDTKLPQFERGAPKYDFEFTRIRKPYRTLLTFSNFQMGLWYSNENIFNVYSTYIT